MMSTTASSRRIFRSLLSVALGSVALFSPLCAHAGFELTPAQTPAKGAPLSGGGAPLPMYEGLKPVDSAPLPKPVVSNKPVPLDMKPLEKKVLPVPVVASPGKSTAASPVFAGVERGALAPDEMLPLPPIMEKSGGMKAESSLSVATVKPVEAQKMAPPPNVPAHPSLTGPIVPSAQKFSAVEGFGRDVPLALAMRQIVPPDYAFSFGDGVDPGQRISWTGGAPWNQVLQKAIESSGLGVDVDGKTVVVAVGKGEAFPPVVTPQLPAVLLQAPPASPAPDSAMMPLPRMAGKPPGAPVPLALSSGNPVPSGPVQKASVPPASARLSSFMKAPVAEPLPVMAKKGVDTESLLPPSSAQGQELPVVPENGVGSGEEARGVSPAPVFAPSVPIVQTKSSDPIPAYPRSFDANAVRDWAADSGSTLRQILSTWSREAGVQLYWSSEYDYPVQADVMLNGTYEKAVATLLDGLRDAQPRPLGRLHPNPPDGPAVLIIETRHILN